MELTKFVVTVRCFDPARPDDGDVYELPVDSPDAEHALSAAMSNAVAFTQKVDGDALRAVAFQPIAIRRR